jgi:NCS2 family nucleobase:cation symporter-2
VWNKGKLRLFSVIIGMVTGYVVSFLTGLMPSAHIQQIFSKPLLALPNVTQLRWSFDASLILPFAIASLCASVKTIGNLATCQKINDADWKRPEMSNIRNGLFADGLGMSISGMIGGMGQSTASSNIGLSVGTGATSRQIAFTTGGILIALAFFPRFAEIFVVMPQPVMGATPLFAICFIIFTGFQIMMSRMMDSRKIFILGISLIFGLSVSALLQVYTQIENPWLRPIFTSSLYIATLLAILLTILFQIGLMKRSRQYLEAGKTTYEHIRDLLEQHGALWGARQEVVNRAVSALNELMEMISAEELTKKPIQMDMSFDEFSLDLILQYEGKPIDITGKYIQPQILEENISIMQLSLCMIRKDVDRLDVTEKGDQQRIVLHYDH